MAHKIKCALEDGSLQRRKVTPMHASVLAPEDSWTPTADEPIAQELDTAFSLLKREMAKMDVWEASEVANNRGTI